MLTQKELLVIYILLCIGTTVASHDFGQILVPLIGHAFWFETPENEWKDLFFPYIPEWLTIQEKSILEGYYNGDSTLYKINQLKPDNSNILVDNFHRRSLWNNGLH